MNTDACPQILDDLYPLFELPKRKWMPRKKGGKTLSRFTALRWALHGRRGVKLRTIMVGGVRCTCDAWAIQFFERLTMVGTADASPLIGRRRDKDHEAAERELTAAGIA